jgi:hypothetical protein
MTSKHGCAIASSGRRMSPFVTMRGRFRTATAILCFDQRPARTGDQTFITWPRRSAISTVRIDLASHT